MCSLNKTLFCITGQLLLMLFLFSMIMFPNAQGQVFCLSHLEETVKDADFIFEVVVENLKVKQDIFESK